MQYAVLDDLQKDNSISLFWFLHILIKQIYWINKFLAVMSFVAISS